MSGRFLLGASLIRAGTCRQSAGLTNQTSRQSAVSPETAAAAVLADTGHLATTAHFTSMTRQSTQAQDGALQPLLERLPPAPSGWRRLVIVMGQLGDFDSMEYAQALVPRLAELEAARIDLQAFAIGDAAGAERFCGFTGFPQPALTVDSSSELHEALGLTGD